MGDDVTDPAAVEGLLHLIVGSGREARVQCLAHAAPGDAVVYLDAGVLHLIDTEAASLCGAGISPHFSTADLDAHGLAGLAREAGVQVVDDPGICELLAAKSHCLTWR